MNIIEKAICYAVYGWWRYYRTASGETFCIRDGKDYFYHGNVKTGENTDVKYLTENEVEAVKKRIEFVG